MNILIYFMFIYVYFVFNFVFCNLIFVVARCSTCFLSLGEVDFVFVLGQRGRVIGGIAQHLHECRPLFKPTLISSHLFEGTGKDYHANMSLVHTYYCTLLTVNVIVLGKFVLNFVSQALWTWPRLR